MGEEEAMLEDHGRTPKEPVFLLPTSVTALVGVLAAIHLVVTFALNREGYSMLLYWAAFQPLRILVATEDLSYAIPLLWSAFTHALLHGGWDHLLVNLAWLAIFASPVARRYGGGPMLAIFFLSAAGGAALFAATTLQAGAYLIGASGGVAGLTGAATRFIFQPVLVAQDPETGERVVQGRHLAGLGGLWRDPRPRMFIIIWVLLNAAVPILPFLTGAQVAIAWQAHLGGFLTGLLIVGLFERRH
jgi:membrane associated rhomboid family serine protease